MSEKSKYYQIFFKIKFIPRNSYDSQKHVINEFNAVTEHIPLNSLRRDWRKLEAPKSSQVEKERMMGESVECIQRMW